MKTLTLASFLSLLLTLSTLILTLLILFAGSSTTFLSTTSLLTLNTSRIGYGTVHLFNTTSTNGSRLSSFINGIESDIDGELSNLTGNLASALHLSDFYTVHLQTYCKGQYTPSASVAAAAAGNNSDGAKIGMNTTFCSSQSGHGLFHFNATNTIQSSLPHGVNLSTIHWPSELSAGEAGVRTAMLATEVLYIIAIITSGIAFLFALVTVFAEGRLTACVNMMVEALAFVALVLASSITTGVIVKSVDLINKYGKGIGVSATKGETIIGMTWAACGCMLLACLMEVWRVIRGRRDRARLEAGEVGKAM